MFLKIIYRQMETRQRAKRKQTGLTAFATCGTTEFDPLMQAVCEPDTLKVLHSHGYTKLVLQLGKGEYIPPDLEGEERQLVDIEHYRYKPSLKEDIMAADLVISHAGAGTCLETLGAGKKLLVVINEGLMGNHQLELARQLHRDGHLHYCTCKTLAETLQKEDFSSLKPFPAGKPEVFAAFLDSVMGFT